MTKHPETSLDIWQTARDDLLRQLADSHLLSQRQKHDLHSDLAYAQSRVRFYKLAVKLEETQAEIEEMKAEV